MAPSTELSGETVTKRCGEIIITMKNNARNVYSFNCRFCDTIYMQMKKFTMHLEKDHELQLIQLEQTRTREHQEENVKAGGDPIVTDSLFLPEIKVEEFLEDDIKSENEEEEHVVTRNTKKESPAKFQDPLETTENAVEEISLPLRNKQQTDDIFNDIMRTKNESPLPSEMEDAKDVEMQTFSDDNMNDRSDFSADESSSGSDCDFMPDDQPPDDNADEGRPTKRVKNKNALPKDKELIPALLDAFKNMPQIWDLTHPEKCTSQRQKDELFQTITDKLNEQLKQKLTLDIIKKKINYLRREYEKEIDKNLHNDEKSEGDEHSDLWYYENMEFLKSTVENKLKLRKKYHQRVKPLSDKLQEDLIDIYKNYNSLWDVNHLAFTVKDKRHETMKTMVDEIKTKMNLTLDIYRLEKHLAHIHKAFAKDKLKRLECEETKEEFQPTCVYYEKCDFLDLHQGPFRCPTCNIIIDTYNDLQMHRSTHDGTAPFKCQECGKAFNKISNFSIHAKRHLRVFKFFCAVCGKGYPFNAELDLHMRSHTGSLPYLCSVCGEGFRTAISYDNHIRRHEERFKYFCHICKKGFNHLTRLNDHVKAHLNVRDIICAVCGKGFTSRKYLNHHKRIHEGKNYICKICGKGFAQDAGLRAHKKYHGTPIGISSIQKEQNKYNLLS